MATTPPSQSLLQTPPTPLHGAKYDSYHSRPTRKSTRHSKYWVGREAQTPPPQLFKSDSALASMLDERIGSAEVGVKHAISPPSSTQNSPQEKLSRQGRSLRSAVAGAMVRPSFAPLEPSLDSSKPSSDRQMSTHLGASMLPTPAKTPRKKIVSAPSLASTARVLFPARLENAEDAMPAVRKRGRKRRHVGFSLDSAGEDDGMNSEGTIQIYTDSKEKVPELDPSEDNPFHDNLIHAASSRHPPRPRVTTGGKSSGSTNNAKEMDAFKRGEGMLYVFRGKKIFRKFPDDEESDIPSPTWHNSESTNESSSRVRPFTRSSITPRLLFPSASQRRDRGLALDEDEEATTDIEELPPLPNDSEMTDLEPESEEEVIKTPVKPAPSIPATPPTTGHATRAATRKAELLTSSPMEPEIAEVPEPVLRRRGKKLSPFDGWQRTKASFATNSSKGKKREGDVLEKDVGVGDTKRIRR